MNGLIDIERLTVTVFHQIKDTCITTYLTLTVTDLEVRDDAVELREAREAEEDVDDVGGELCVLLPVFAQYPRQRAHHRL